MPDELKSTMFDVVAVNIKTRAMRVIASDKTGKDAETIVDMAVARRGVDEEFFDVVPHGSVQKMSESSQSQTADAGKLNGVPQRRAGGGYYAQYEVDEILELEAEWIIEYVKYATRHKERQDGKL